MTEASDIPAPPGPVSIVLFRDDLRLGDNPALAAALAVGRPVLALFLTETGSAARPRGAASRWWLHHSLIALAASIESRGGRLLVADGPSENVVPALAVAIGARGVFWNRRYGLPEREADGRLKSALRAAGVAAESHNGRLLREPWEVTSKQGGSLRVFTPFFRALTALAPPAAPLPAPARLSALDPAVLAAAGRASPAILGDGAAAVSRLGLLPKEPDWSGGIAAEWRPGEASAKAALEAFLDGALDGYGAGRNRPDRVSTSRLSPHLAFGEITPRQIWHVLLAAEEAGRLRASGDDLLTFRKEIGWREFSYHLLYHHPDLASANHQPKFDAFPWRTDPEALKAWRRGRTGYPIVDAGMRQLWTTGWMHNRVRMVVASFLVKHLLIDWRVGEAWFWDTLVDADPANNAASWQWVAGSGADAAPYFRIFNPVSQGEKFDPEGLYVKRYVPELAALPAAAVHAPWSAPPGLRLEAGVRLGATYPAPIVDHEKSRARALAAFKSIGQAAA
jgi:deoxyribodipyrimidine photo-lyase